MDRYNTKKMHQIEFEWIKPIEEGLDYKEMDFSHERMFKEHVHDILKGNKALPNKDFEVYRLGNKIIRDYVNRRVIDREKVRNQLIKDGIVI